MHCAGGRQYLALFRGVHHTNRSDDERVSVTLRFASSARDDGGDHVDVAVGGDGLGGVVIHIFLFLIFVVFVAMVKGLLKAAWMEREKENKKDEDALDSGSYLYERTVFAGVRALTRVRACKHAYCV